jgi:hypothetical protein
VKFQRTSVGLDVHARSVVPAAAPGLVASVRRPIARSRPWGMPSNETSDSRSAGISCDRQSVST